jgi:Rrf2 family protein
MLSRTAEYALRAVLFLADRGEPTNVDLIAQRLDVPRNYLSKILHRLARDGVLSSTLSRGSAAACWAGRSAATRTRAPPTASGSR